PFTESPQEFVLPDPRDWQQELGLKRFSNEINWITMISESYRGYVRDRNFPMILKSAQIIADAIPHNDKANYEFGRLLVQDGRPDEAQLYFKRALLEQPDNSLYQKAYKLVSQ
ncbi:MAG: tetratricopeptide repeat protein, partial [Enterobacterales bacterium]|nr:tetratricopeptide repeat protein [Enterobacterales bacterium]